MNSFDSPSKIIINSICNVVNREASIVILNDICSQQFKGISVNVRRGGHTYIESNQSHKHFSNMSENAKNIYHFNTRNFVLHCISKELIDLVHDIISTWNKEKKIKYPPYHFLNIKNNLKLQWLSEENNFKINIESYFN